MRPSADIIDGLRQAHARGDAIPDSVLVLCARVEKMEEALYEAIRLREVRWGGRSPYGAAVESLALEALALEGDVP